MFRMSENEELKEDISISDCRWWSKRGKCCEPHLWFEDFRDEYGETECIFDGAKMEENPCIGYEVK